MEKIKEWLNKGIGKVKKEWNNLIRNFKNIKQVSVEDLLNESKIIFISFMCILICFVFVFISGLNSNKSDALIGIKNGLLNGKTHILSKYITIQGERVSGNELQPLIDYYDGDEDRINNLYTDLNQNGRSGNFTLSMKDKFFGEKYYVNINKVELILTSELDGVDVVIGNKKFKLKDEAVIDIVPGSYDIGYKYESEYGDVSGSVKATIIEDSKYQLALPVNYVTLYSNYEDSKVYINGEETELTAGDIKNYGPIPVDKDVALYIEKEFPWGVLKSDEVKINKESYIKLDINMVNDELVNEVESVVNGFYDSVFEALNKKDKKIIDKCTDKVRDLVYNYINEKTLIFSNNYEIIEMNVEIEKSDFAFEDGKYKASILTKINYTVSKKLLPFLKEQQETHFQLSMEYTDIGFVVNGIQKMEL